MDITDIRRANLRMLARERSVQSLAKALGYTQSGYISSIIGPAKARPLTEKNARRFEKLLGLPHRWFDEPHDTVAPAPPAAPDMSVVTEAIRMVSAVAGEEKVDVPSEKFGGLVELAVADATAHGGKPRKEYLKTVVKLMK